MTRSELLGEYGITERPPFRVTAIQERGVLWLVGIAAFGEPLKGISAKDAAELAGRLHSFGEEELAHRISATAEEALKSNASSAAG
jgi:hypothetical protein